MRIDRKASAVDIEATPRRFPSIKWRCL